jgi:hypothetical protein
LAARQPPAMLWACAARPGAGTTVGRTVVVHSVVVHLQGEHSAAGQSAGMGLSRR